jgi:hypothetical protein
VGVAGCHASTSARSFDNYCANQIAPIHPTYDELPVSAEPDGVCGHSRPDRRGAACEIRTVGPRRSAVGRPACRLGGRHSRPAGGSGCWQLWMTTRRPPSITDAPYTNAHRVAFPVPTVRAVRVIQPQRGDRQGRNGALPATLVSLRSPLGRLGCLVLKGASCHQAPVPVSAATRLGRQPRHTQFHRAGRAEP